MPDIAEMLSQTVQALGGSARLEGVSITPQFLSGQAPAPLRGMHAVAGLGSLEYAPGAMGGYLGDNETGEQSGRRVNISLSITLYAPYETGGSGLFTIYSAVSDCLFAAKLPYSVKRGKAGSISFDKALRAYKLECAFEAEGYAADELCFEPFDSVEVELVRPV